MIIYAPWVWPKILSPCWGGWGGQLWHRPTSISTLSKVIKNGRDIYGDGNAYWLNSPAQKALYSLGWDPLFVSRGWFLDSWLVILRESFNFLTGDERKNIGTRAWYDVFSLVSRARSPSRVHLRRRVAFRAVAFTERKTSVSGAAGVQYSGN